MGKKPQCGTCIDDAEEILSEERDAVVVPLRAA
jgi:bacterioferritin-associated ferredoxin